MTAAKTPRSRSKAMPERERCPGTGAYAKDRAGNPRGSCPNCGKSCKLTKRGTIWHHKVDRVTREVRELHRQAVVPVLISHSELSIEVDRLKESLIEAQAMRDYVQTCLAETRATRDLLRADNLDLQDQVVEALKEIDRLLDILLYHEFSEACSISPDLLQ